MIGAVRSVHKYTLRPCTNAWSAIRPEPTVDETQSTVSTTVREGLMTASTRIRFTAFAAAALSAVALAPAASASVNPDLATETAGAAGHQGDAVSTVVLRRSPEAAVPFVAETAPGHDQPAAGSGDSFDWGDAAIGAGASLAVVAVGLAGIGAISDGRRRYSSARPRGTASQGV